MRKHFCKNCGVDLLDDVDCDYCDECKVALILSHPEVDYIPDKKIEEDNDFDYIPDKERELAESFLRGHPIRSDDEMNEDLRGETSLHEDKCKKGYEDDPKKKKKSIKSGRNAEKKVFR